MNRHDRKLERTAINSHTFPNSANLFEHNNGFPFSNFDQHSISATVSYQLLTAIFVFSWSFFPAFDVYNFECNALAFGLDGGEQQGRKQFCNFSWYISNWFNIQNLVQNYIFISYNYKRIDFYPRCFINLSVQIYSSAFLYCH